MPSLAVQFWWPHWQVELLWWFRHERLCLQCRRPKFDPWGRKLPWRRNWQPTLVSLPGKAQGQMIMGSQSPWGRKESDTTFTFHFLEVTFLPRSYNTGRVYRLLLKSVHWQRPVLQSSNWEGLELGDKQAKTAKILEILIDGVLFDVILMKRKNSKRVREKCLYQKKKHIFPKPLNYLNGLNNYLAFRKQKEVLRKPVPTSWYILNSIDENWI